ncbi:MAG: pyruvate carboxylase, partial [bacterium]
MKDILVANRGEIAIRIFRACTELGIRTTAIYSYEDRLSIHRYKADRAYLVGEAGKPVEAYLDGDAIIELAKRHGIDAIHPGYGFLSENADFAQKCIDAGIIWIGPPPAVMRALGDKVRARKAAIAAGIPVVPGTEDAIDDVKKVHDFAAQHGFPLLVKAAHGGGGRGMRVVKDASEIDEAFNSARSEARSAFGSDEVFIERYVNRPRHIEVQIVADHHGNRVHFYERDCSIQRRHQKVVELAPAPNLSPDVRDDLCRYSLQLADATGYASVGTVEFLVEERDGKSSVYFIEVNTRIQVEHTVTEMVTGYDLIKTMIRIAEGHKLADPEIGITSQDVIGLNGQALQCRITTEDPEKGFAPDYGKIITYRSAAGFGIRLDAGIGGSGALVQPFYDSMLVKVSAWGRDLQDASQRMGRSLAEFRIRGVKTNLPFLTNVVKHPQFLTGNTHTRFIDETPELFVYPKRRDRGTKAVRALADITINGPPGGTGRNKRPQPLLLPNPPELTTHADPPKSSAFAALEAGGPEGLAKWMRSHDKLLITDTTFRDAHQSLLATRVRTRDITAVARQSAHMLPEMFSFEVWGGATFDVCMRFLKEDPWKRLDAIRKRMPGQLLQMLLRGANAVGYTNYPDNVVRAFIEEAAKGIDVFRIFDALNYVPNMELAIEEVAKQGKIAEACLCYTGDVLSPTEDKYTIQYYVDLAKQLEARGAHVLAIKDMAGLLKPHSAKALISALRDNTDLPIHLHTHDTAGNGVAMYMMASEAGVDCVDCALSSMSGLTSQPSLNALVEALEPDPRRPNLDVDSLQTLSEYWERIREIYYPFESGLKSGTTDVYFHEIPGGQYSNLRPRAVQLGLGDKWNLIKTTYHEVNLAMGNIVKVTPTSKVVADFAMFLVRNDMTVQQLFERHDAGESFDFPQSVVDFFMGLIGQPHGGFPPKLQKMVIRDKKPYVDRAGQYLPDYQWSDHDVTLKTLLDREPTRRERISHALYPKVFSEMAAETGEFGEYYLL